MERGAYSQSQMTRIYLVTFQSFCHILRNKHTILRLKYIIFDNVFIPNHTKINMQGFVAKNGKYLVNSRILCQWGGGLNREGILREGP